MEAFTSKVPMGRLAVPEELADAFISLLGGSASYVSGQVLSVDGALTTSR
jgi:NAD(P)-dependent dehydrogenase (short-subunit alcohol dehydrogenase family)